MIQFKDRTPQTRRLKFGYLALITGLEQDFIARGSAKPRGAPGWSIWSIVMVNGELGCQKILTLNGLWLDNDLGIGPVSNKHMIFSSFTDSDIPILGLGK